MCTNETSIYALGNECSICSKMKIPTIILETAVFIADIILQFKTTLKHTDILSNNDSRTGMNCCVISY